MQTSHLLIAFVIIAVITGCGIVKTSEEQLNPAIIKAKDLVYTNHLEEAERVLLNIDTTELNKKDKGAYCLTKAFLNHELGNRPVALASMSRAFEFIPSSNSDLLKAELSLINGFIFEQLILRSEALKSYFEAYDFFLVSENTDKLFYTLLGIARTSPNGYDYLKQAEELLDQLSSNRFKVLYLNAQANLISDVQKRNWVMVKSLDYFEEYYALKKQINIYSGIALNYQLLEQVDSSYYYLTSAQKIIDSNQLTPKRNLHFYLIRAYIQARNKQYDQALETLEILFDHAANEPGILSLTYLRRSIIMKYQGKFEEAHFDLKKYTKFEEEERAKAEKYQLGLLSIQYQVKEKELQLAKVKLKWMATTIVLIGFLALGGILFSIYRRRVLLQKQTIISKLDYTRRRFEEHVHTKFEHAEAILSNITDQVEVLDQLKCKTQFDVYFDIHHPKFKDKLLKQHPQLSRTDLRYCMCLLAELTLYQTAALLQVSKGAVKKGRKKVREYLEIASLEELTRYFKTLDEN